MSEASLQRLLDTTIGQLEAACREGRGDQLLHDHFTAVAEDFASNVFLKMDDVVAKALPHQSAELLEWAQAFPNAQGLALVESVLSTCQEYRWPEDKSEALAAASARAFSDRLGQLLEASSAGGSV